MLTLEDSVASQFQWVHFNTKSNIKYVVLRLVAGIPLAKWYYSTPVGVKKLPCVGS